MSRDEVEGLNELYLELLESDLPDPELLARYAETPNELSEDERNLVEGAMARSPLVVDELDTIRGFDFEQLDADLEEPGAGRAGVWQGWLQRPTVWAGLMAAAALLVWFAVGREAPVDRLDGPDRAPEQIAEDSIRDAPRAPSSESFEPRDEPAPETPNLPDEPMLADTEPAPSEAPGSSIERETGVPEALPADLDPTESAPVLPEVQLAMLMPRYESPMDAASRSAGVSVYRSSGDPKLEIRTLAPNHVAWAGSPQPILYWSVDRIPKQGAFYLTISDVDDNVIADNLAIAQAVRAGIQRISLADLELSLPENVEVRWSVSHRLEEESPPTEYAFGWIRIVKISPSLGEEIAAVAPGELPDLLARSGYWYDSVDAIRELEREFPANESAGEALRSLLDQGAGANLSD